MNENIGTCYFKISISSAIHSDTGHFYLISQAQKSPNIEKFPKKYRADTFLNTSSTLFDTFSHTSSILKSIRFDFAFEYLPNSAWKLDKI